MDPKPEAVGEYQLEQPFFLAAKGMRNEMIAIDIRYNYRVHHMTYRLISERT